MMLKKARSLALIAGWLLASCTSLPDMSKEHLAAARQAREKGELEPALRALTDAVNSASELSFFFTEALLERGDLYLELWESRTGVSETERLELLANAQADYQAVATWDRPEPLDRARALEGHGRVHLRRGAPAEAMRLFREVLAIRGATEEANDPLREVHLSVHRQLGWIILNESLHRLPLDGKPPAAELDVLREAQEHFYAGLEISRDDPLSNLGRGICLHLRGQSDLAIEHIEHYVANARSPDPRGLFFLAQAIERANGLHHDAIDLYERAFETEPPRTFFPLYRHHYVRGEASDPSRALLGHYIHVATVLPSYLSANDPRLPTFLRHLTAFETRTSAYWERIALLASTYLESRETTGELETICRFARALASARLDLVDEAVDWLVPLVGHPDFEDFVARVFPTGRGARPRDVLGRTLVFERTGQQDELETWFRTSGVEASLAESLKTDPASRRVLLLRARNLLSIYEKRAASTGSTPEPLLPAEAPSLLVLARKAFEDCVYNEDDLDTKAAAQLGLARTLEYLGSFAEALSLYEKLSQTRPTDEIYRRVKSLHEAANLKEEERAQALALLRGYSGDDRVVREYVEKLSSALAGRICTGCGRRNSSGQRICIECGRPLAPEAPPGPVERR